MTTDDFFKKEDGGPRYRRGHPFAQADSRETSPYRYRYRRGHRYPVSSVDGASLVAATQLSKSGDFTH